MRIFIRCSECNKMLETKMIEALYINENQFEVAMDIRAICKKCDEELKK